VIAEKTFPTNKPDIIIHDSNKRNLSVVGTAIPRGRNIIKKKPKILKCKALTTETQFLWNVKSKLLPVKIGATGTTSK